MGCRHVCVCVCACEREERREREREMRTNKSVEKLFQAKVVSSASQEFRKIEKLYFTGVEIEKNNISQNVWLRTFAQHLFSFLRLLNSDWIHLVNAGLVLLVGTAAGVVLAQAASEIQYRLEGTELRNWKEGTSLEMNDSCCLNLCARIFRLHSEV